MPVFYKALWQTEASKIVRFGWNLIHLLLRSILGLAIFIFSNIYFWPLRTSFNTKTRLKLEHAGEFKNCLIELKFDALVPLVNTWGIFLIPQLGLNDLKVTEIWPCLMHIFFFLPLHPVLVFRALPLSLCPGFDNSKI